MVFNNNLKNQQEDYHKFEATLTHIVSSRLVSSSYRFSSVIHAEDMMGSCSQGVAPQGPTHGTQVLQLALFFCT